MNLSFKEMENLMIFKNMLIVCLLLAYTLGNHALAAAEHLPFMSVSGNTTSGSLITLKGSIRATNLKDPSCYSLVYRRGLKVKNPHTYKVKTNSFADYYGEYSVDMDVDSRLLRQIRKDVSNGVLELENNFSVVDYKNLCSFAMKGIELNLEDTLLVIRQSSHTVFLSVFNVIKGSTTSQSFDFSHIPYINLEVNVLSKK